MQWKNSKQSSAPLILDGERKVAVSEEIFAEIHVFTNIFQSMDWTYLNCTFKI